MEGCKWEGSVIISGDEVFGETVDECFKVGEDLVDTIVVGVTEDCNVWVWTMTVVVGAITSSQCNTKMTMVGGGVVFCVSTEGAGLQLVVEVILCLWHCGIKEVDMLLVFDVVFLIVV